MKDIAGRLKDAGRAADQIIAAYREGDAGDAAELADVVKRYITVKLRLQEEEVSDLIGEMVRFSVSKASGIPVEKLKEMDRPGACGSAPAVLSQKILLLLDIQNKLSVKMPPQAAVEIRTVRDLADVLMPLVRSERESVA